MTIWLLTLILLASLAGLGYRQGAIRVGFSFLGIFFGTLLAVPLGHLLKHLLSLVGMKNPVLLYFVPPLLVFAIILTIFKIGALTVHKKVEVYYKYRAGDLRLALWERLNHRVGLCLGLANGTAYLILITFVIYIFSYCTVQVANAESDSFLLRVFNRLGTDLESSGMFKVARAVDKMPASYYEAADVAGMIYRTPEMQPRLGRYPAFLGLNERSDFQDLANDQGFRDLRQKQASFKELLNYPKVQTIVKSPETLNTIWAEAQPNLQDLTNFLVTGKSEKFDAEKMIGRWNFDLNGAVGLVRKARPTLTPNQVSQIRGSMAGAFAKTTFVATPEQQAFLKNIPRARAAAAGASPTPELQTLQGEWKGSAGKYELTFMIDGKPESMSGEFDGNRLTITGAGMQLAFTRAD